MSRLAVAGVDSSTQQTKLIVVDALSGELLRSSALPHPDGTDIDPEQWWFAFDGVGGTQLDAVAALSIAAQQHTAIFLDAHGQPVRNAILWNDLRAMASADELVAEIGADVWLERTGLIPDSAHPVSKLRWLSTHHPELADRVEWTLMPHDWLTWRVHGQENQPTTDRSDASATGYWSPLNNEYHDDLLTHSFGRRIHLPDIVGPGHAVGKTPAGTLIGAGCGDNAATHLALNTCPGDVVISVGTSTTVSMRTTRIAYDRHGYIDTMGDARDGFIPIVAMLNGARLFTAMARLLGASLGQFDALAASARPDAGGITLLPFLDGERNPRRPKSDGMFSDVNRSALTPQNLARAAMLGIGCATANALDAIRVECGPARRVFLVGGGSRSQTFRQVLADLSKTPIRVPADREHAAYGAARQAAWTLLGSNPAWAECPTDVIAPSDAPWVSSVRAAYDAHLSR
ncbi:FGGY-family carbohydrate kinase [Microbacterium sp. MPKO10]|uniref:xylulokinase n=1 Tax=Microbacterium sp. MPKO10 TaxID=2989818 RepID=UPI002236817B|nr:FGGY family carbohydrate kinase [Microbacterium sp. MPKO10]MCW4457727.1 FGGY family carbohydrate kinase [Microbacterium sp. MPKO10]